MFSFSFGGVGCGEEVRSELVLFDSPSVSLCVDFTDHQSYGRLAEGVEWSLHALMTYVCLNDTCG